MAKAFIGLGGNVGDSRQILTDAVICLAQIPSIAMNPIHLMPFLVSSKMTLTNSL
jgi:7,8-dihydro-6-hydroxymethylpterin-pyrophosphokinase